MLNPILFLLITYENRNDYYTIWMRYETKPYLKEKATDSISKISVALQVI